MKIPKEIKEEVEHLRMIEKMEFPHDDTDGDAKMMKITNFQKPARLSRSKIDKEYCKIIPYKRGDKRCRLLDDNRQKQKRKNHLTQSDSTSPADKSDSYYIKHIIVKRGGFWHNGNRYSISKCKK